MQYMLLIYQNEAEVAAHQAADPDTLYAEYGTFTQAIVRNGSFVAGNPLHPTSAATAVRLRDGKTLTSDGPVIKSDQQLAGYYLIEAGNLQEAIGIASQVPSARFGAIEIRPIMAM